MLNKFKVKMEMYGKLADFVETIDTELANLEARKNELEEQKENGEELKFWEQAYLDDFPVKVEAYKTIKTHLEKLL